MCLHGILEHPGDIKILQNRGQAVKTQHAHEQLCFFSVTSMRTNVLADI